METSLFLKPLVIQEQACLGYLMKQTQQAGISSLLQL